MGLQRKKFNLSKHLPILRGTWAKTTTFRERVTHLCRREMQGRPPMLVTDVDVGDAGLQQPRQRLRVVGVGRQTDLPLNDARF